MTYCTSNVSIARFHDHGVFNNTSMETSYVDAGTKLTDCSSPGGGRVREVAGPLHGHDEEQGPGVRGTARQSIRSKGTCNLRVQNGKKSFEITFSLYT